MEKIVYGLWYNDFDISKDTFLMKLTKERRKKLKAKYKKNYGKW